MEALRADDPVRVGGYRLVARMGAGSMGRVFLGQDPSGSLVAVKVVHARFAHRQDRRERFAHEVAAARRINSAYVAPVVDHDVNAAEPWLATAYLPGLDLRQAVAAHGPLGGRSVRALAASLATALNAIHQAGVLHRDLKPSNLVLTPAGPRVVDFSIASPDGADDLTLPGAVLGTPGYIPPERIRDRDSGRPGDVFALGALLVFAATGEGPFGSGSAQALLYRTQFEDPRLDDLRTALERDRELIEIIESCLARDPRRRPTAAELVGRLSGGPEPTGTRWLPEAMALSVTDAGEMTPVDRASQADSQTDSQTASASRSRRNVLVIGLGAAVVTGLGSAAALAALRSGDSDNSRAAAPDDTRSATRDNPRTAARRPAGANDPSPVWTYRSPGKGDVFNRPTVLGNVVYLSSTKGLHALGCSRGDLKWKATSNKPVSSGVTAMGSEAVLFRDGLDLRAVKAVDGSPFFGWQRLFTGTTGQPLMNGKEFYLCNGIGRLSANDTRTGRPLWVRLLDRPIGVPDTLRVTEDDLEGVLAGGLLYVAPGALVAFDLASRDEKWRFKEATTPPAVHGGVVYSAGTSYVYALDAESGALRWSRDIGDRLTGRVTLGDGLVFAGDSAGRLHALDAGTGRPRWRFVTEGALRAGSTVSAGTVYAGADQDRLYAIGAADGRLRWSHPLGRQTKVHAQVWRDRILVCVDLNQLSAFPR
jgi:serine/threonine protein kinase